MRELSKGCLGSILVVLLSGNPASMLWLRSADSLEGILIKRSPNATNGGTHDMSTNVSEPDALIVGLETRNHGAIDVQ